MIPEEPVVLTTTDGVTLEARRASPAAATAGMVVCHPHPLYGGEMDNAVVAAVVATAAKHGLATLRFNFRGVGRSTGRHGDGIAETADVEAAIDALRRALEPPAGILLAGYSFGAAVAARAAARTRLSGLVLIAPALAVASLATLEADVPTVVIAGSDDDYCPRDRLDGLRAASPAVAIRIIPGTDHFFSGALRELGLELGAWLGERVAAT